jgi:hypothetical protein
MGEFFRVLELEFLIKNFEKLCNHLFSAKGWNLQNALQEAFQVERKYS